MASESNSSGAPTCATASDSQSTPRVVWLVLATVALVLLVLTKSKPGSWADATRLATIESLVEHGTLAIDDSTYFWQGDKVHFAPHYYSHQPPMMAMVGALPYALLHHVGGLSIAEAVDDPAGPSALIVYRALTWSLVGLPVLVGLWALSRLIAATGCGPRWNAGLIAITGLATLLLPYSLVLNQHGAAAGLVCAAFFAIQRRHYALAGLLLATATTTDLTAVFPSLACLWPVLRNGRFGALAYYALGAMPVLALHFAVNFAVAGDLVPFGMHDEAFRYPMSPFMFMSLTGLDQIQVDGQRVNYLLGATFGHSGLFSHHPQLLFALAAGLALCFRFRPAASNGPNSALRPGLLPAAALSALGITVFYIFQSSNYGGSSFGMRWFTVFVPLLALFPAAYLGARARAGNPWRPGLIAMPLLGLCLLIALPATVIGAANPWAKFHYRWVDSPEGLAALPGEAVPSQRDHWKSEWRRVRGPADPITRIWYDQTFSRLMDQHRRVYLRPLPGVADDVREAWIRSGLEVLHAVVDEMDSGQVRDYSRIMGHFWLGKFYAALDDRVTAETEFQIALEFDPNHGPSLNALAKLRSE